MDKSTHAHTNREKSASRADEGRTIPTIWLGSDGSGDFVGEELDDREFLPDRSGQPCPVCQATGACGFDLCNRPLIHVLDWGSDDA